jgi:hypothetical protein
MEVHAHAHTERKKWTHYLWEFLMLFLAVFCGFLAENQREHMVEHQREKQFAKQLLADLRADSFVLSTRIERMNGILKKHQQFYQLMTGPVKPTNKEILNNCLPLLYLFNMPVTTGAYNQMKASGALRYIQNENLTNALQKYYEVLIPMIASNVGYESNYYANNIDPFVLKHFRAQDFDYAGDSVKTAVPVILDRTNQADQELLNIIEGYANSHKVILERSTIPAQRNLNKLIDLLKKEYHFK